MVLMVTGIDLPILQEYKVEITNEEREFQDELITRNTLCQQSPINKGKKSTRGGKKRTVLAQGAVEGDIEEEHVKWLLASDSIANTLCTNTVDNEVEIQSVNSRLSSDPLDEIVNREENASESRANGKRKRTDKTLKSGRKRKEPVQAPQKERRELRQRKRQMMPIVPVIERDFRISLSETDSDLLPDDSEVQLNFAAKRSRKDRVKLKKKRGERKNNLKNSLKKKEKKPANDNKAVIEKKSVCSECGAAFQKNHFLLIHIRSHSGEKPFVCQECNKCFSVWANLQRHLRIHTGEKPYKCEDCGKSFNISTNLKRHMKIHSGDKPHVCDKCEMAFITRTDLRRHMRRHTGETPLQCQHCDAQFANWATFNYHRKKHNHF